MHLGGHFAHHLHIFPYICKEVNDMKKRKLKTSKAEVYLLEDFMSYDECDEIIKMIDKSAKRSKIMKSNDVTGVSKLSKHRTSSTANINHKRNPLIKIIDKRISKSINVPLELGEGLQGQRYEVGEEFKRHTDFFGPIAMKAQAKHNWGDRTWTFMIYLNDDCKGGETRFTKLNTNFKPKKGNAVAWNNRTPTGKLNKFTEHAGLPVRAGKKYIVTKWFREKPAGTYPLSKYFKDTYPELVTAPRKVKYKHKPKGSKPVRVYESWKDLPKCTERGFAVIDVPDHTWKFIQRTYERLKPRIKPEKFKGQMKIIHDIENKTSPVDILNLAHDKAAKTRIHKEILPILTKWSGVDITASMMYGIRSYRDGAILENHRDRERTHHISCIVIVDDKSQEPWPLNIEDHEGNMHEIITKPGQMIMYESATCLHGRMKPLKAGPDGYFRNFFIHYSLDGWKYEGKQK